MISTSYTRYARKYHIYLLLEYDPRTHTADIAVLNLDREPWLALARDTSDSTRHRFLEPGPTEVVLDSLGVEVSKQLTSRWSSLLPLAQIIRVPAAAEQVLHRIHGAKLSGNVAAIGLLVAEDNAVSEDCIVGLEDLGRVANGGTESSDVVRSVRECMKFRLGRDF
jgi:hypothetical protein